MSYTSALATRILATHCCACGLPLLEAESVEAGIGPICRQKYMGKRQGHGDEARGEANQIVHRLALAISGVDGQTIGAGLAERGETGASHLVRLRELGFVKLAEKLEKAWVRIRIEETDGVLSVQSPYLDEAVVAARAIPGRAWDGARKCNTFPASQRPAVWRLLRKFYAGVAGIGPEGVFVVSVDVTHRPDDVSASRAA